MLCRTGTCCRKLGSCWDNISKVSVGMSNSWTLSSLFGLCTKHQRSGHEIGRGLNVLRKYRPIFALDHQSIRVFTDSYWPRHCCVSHLVGVYQFLEKFFGRFSHFGTDLFLLSHFPVDLMVYSYNQSTQFCQAVLLLLNLACDRRQQRIRLKRDRRWQRCVRHTDELWWCLCMDSNAFILNTSHGTGRRRRRHQPMSVTGLAFERWISDRTWDRIWRCSEWTRCWLHATQRKMHTRSGRSWREREFSRSKIAK